MILSNFFILLLKELIIVKSKWEDWESFTFRFLAHVSSPPHTHTPLFLYDSVIMEHQTWKRLGRSSSSTPWSVQIIRSWPGCKLPEKIPLSSEIHLARSIPGLSSTGGTGCIPCITEGRGQCRFCPRFPRKLMMPLDSVMCEWNPMSVIFNQCAASRCAFFGQKTNVVLWQF